MKLTAFLDKAQYLPGDTVKLTLNADAAGAEVTLTRLEQAVPCVCQWEGREICLSGLPEGCYGLTVTAAGGRWEGAFDIVHDRRSVTRYGFLSDFGPGDGDPEAVQWLRACTSMPYNSTTGCTVTTPCFLRRIGSGTLWTGKWI